MKITLNGVLTAAVGCIVASLIMSMVFKNRVTQSGEVVSEFAGR